jgi:hypothetical protein
LNADMSEFAEELLDADRFEDLPGMWQGRI